MGKPIITITFFPQYIYVLINFNYQKRVCTLYYIQPIKISLAWDIGKIVDPDQTPQRVASDTYALLMFDLFFCQITELTFSIYIF